MSMINKIFEIVAFPSEILMILYILVVVGVVLAMVFFALYIMIGSEARTVGWAKIKGRVLIEISSKDKRSTFVSASKVSGGWKVRGMGIFISANNSVEIMRQGLRKINAWRHFAGTIPTVLPIQAELLSSLMGIDSYREAIGEIAKKAYEVIAQDELMLEAKKTNLGNQLETITAQRTLDKVKGKTSKSLDEKYDDIYNQKVKTEEILAETKKRLEANQFKIKIEDPETSKVQEIDTNSWKELLNMAREATQRLIGDPNRPNKEFIKKYGYFLDVSIAGESFKFETLSSWMHDVSPEVITDMVSEQLADYKDRMGKSSIGELLKFMGIAMILLVFFLGLYMVFGQLMK